MNICGYYNESINEGVGLRAVIFIAGCKHYCKGCFNASTWSFQAGDEFTTKRQDEIIENVRNNPLLDGISIVGGDPFFSARDVLAFVHRIKAALPDLNIWIYSGFAYEEIAADPDRFALLRECHVLVDGKFILEQRDVTLRFRGSGNQRIIDIPGSLNSGKVVVLDI